MKKHLLFVLIPLVSAILLSGCSLEDIFAKLATSKEEQGARQSYYRDQMVAAKQKRIDAKKQQFSKFINLTKVNESDPFEALVFYSFDKNSAKIDIEAILPDPGRQIYEAWVRNPQTKASIRLGALRYNNPDDYSLSYQGELNLTSYSNVILTRESTPDDQPETILMTGALTTSTP